MYPYHLLMEIYELLILMSPGLCPAVVGIGKSNHTGLITVLYGGIAGPGKLQEDSLPEHRFAHILPCRLRAKA